MKKLIAVVIISITLISLNACTDTNDKIIEFTQNANGSAGNYWEYSLSNNDVIKETDYYETSFLGPGYTQHWKFKILNDGNVTIHWTAYEGSSVSEKDSYDMTYYMSDGKLRLILNPETAFID